LIKEFEYRGVWWLPEDPGREVGGILKFSPGEGARLELTGALKEPASLIRRLSAPELIFGKVFGRGKVTLYRCLEVKRHINTAETSDLIADVAFLGDHVDPRRATFSSMSVESSELDLWANVNWVEFPDLSELAGRNFSIRFYKPELLEARLDNGIKVTLGVGIEGPQMSWVQTEVRLKRKIFVRVIPPSPCPFEECLNLVQAMLDLASLGILHPAIPNEIVGMVEERESEGSEPIRIEILYRLSRKPSFDRASLHPYAVLFSLADIYERFEEFVRNWFDTKARLEPVWNLYLATLHAPEMYVESHFLNIVHALEAFHRLTVGGHELPEDEHGKRVDEIINSAPCQWCQWLMDKLRYSNEPSLRSRLIKVCGMFPSVTGRLIGNQKAVKRFVCQVVDTRNYMTHHDPELGQSAARGISLFPLTEKLKILVECCLLRELGFPDEFISERIGRARLDRMPQVR
jgi:hypothetical protein